MRDRIIFTLTFLFLLIPLATAANDFAYNRLYEDGQIIDGLNYSINVNHSSSSDYATMAGDSLLFNGYSLFNYINSYVRGEGLVCFLSGGTDCTMSGNIIGSGNSLLDFSFLEIKRDSSDFLTPGINVSNSNTYGTSFSRFENDVGGQLDIGVYGYGLGQDVFPGQLNENQSAMGISNRGGDIWISTRNYSDILFGASPNDSLADTEFDIRIDTELGAIVLQGDKNIRPVRTDGVESLFFESNVGAAEGEITFCFVGRDSNNNSIVQRCDQIGKNNSASIQGMNSQILAPKTFLTMTEEVKLAIDANSGDPIIEEWFNNITSCLAYQEYLQGQGLLPEGLSQVCDTTGRLVPQSILGDVDIVRGLTTHESITAYNAFDFIGRVGNDAGFFFNNESGGKLHVRDNRVVEANFSELDTSICNFDDGTLCGANVESIDPEAGRDWRNVLEPQCHDDRCAKANGGNLKIISVDDDTIGISNINVSFWLTSIMSGGDSLTINVDDNQGNNADVLTITTTEIDTLHSFLFPPTYENKPNVTTTYTFSGQNNNRIIWLDNIRANVDFDPAILFNESYEGGWIVLGEDRGSLSCGMKVVKEQNNDSIGTHWVTEIGCPDGVTRILGNATFVDTTVVNETIIGNQLIQGNLVVENDTQSDTFTLNGTTIFDWFDIDLDNKYFRLDGTSQMQGNTIATGYNATYSYVNATDGITSGSPLTVNGGLGPSNILIIADSDNSNENDVATLSLSQDGGLIDGYLGFLSSNDLVLDHTGVSGAWGLGFARNGVIQLGTDGDGNAYALNNMTADYFIGNGSQLTGITHTPELWNRTGTILSPKTAGDDIETTGTVTATGTGTHKLGLWEITQQTLASGENAILTNPSYQGRINLAADELNAIFTDDDALYNQNGGLYGVKLGSFSNNFDRDVLDVIMSLDADTGNVDITSGFDFNVLGGDVDVEGDLYVDRIALGQDNLSVNSSIILSSGDILGDTAYFNVYAGRSPIPFCDGDFCSVDFPKQRKTLWLEKDEDWNILDIEYNGSHYTKQSFYDLVKGTQYEEMALRLNSKIKKLNEKATCENNGFLYDTTCYEKVEQTTTYENAIEITQKEKLTTIQETCTQLNSQLIAEEVSCSKRVGTGEFETIYKFKNNCNWNKDAGYSCITRQPVIV